MSNQTFGYKENGEKIIVVRPLNRNNTEKSLKIFIRELCQKGVIDLNKFNKEMANNIYHSFDETLDDNAQKTLDKLDELAEKTNNKLDELAEKTIKIFKKD